MVTACSFSDVGGHRVNEDAFAVFQHPDDPACWICTLADGQGGRAGGGRASGLACQTVERLAKAESINRLVNVRVWQNFFRETDEIVAADADAGLTALVGFCVINDRVFGGSNGDSAVAVVDKGRKCDELTREQMKNPPIGSGAAAFVPFAKMLRHPWTIVAMSDGVWKYARWDRIEAAASRLQGSALIMELEQHARLPGSGKFQDDFTIVVLQCDPDDS